MSLKRFLIDRPSVFLHAEPSALSPVSDQLLYGTVVTVLSPSADTPFVRCETDYGYCGFLNGKYLRTEEPVGLFPFIVKAPFCDLLPDRRFRRRPLTSLSRGCVVYAAHKHLARERFSPVRFAGRELFVPTQALSPFAMRQTPVPEKERDVFRRKLCDDALSYLGTPYRFGGKETAGIDCSGLCFMAYRLNGLPLWRDAAADKRYVSEIRKEDLLAGDLIYFRGHMALYIGDGEYVHASASAGMVTVSSLNAGSVIYRADLADKIVCFARSVFL